MTHKAESRERERQRNADKAAEIAGRFKLYCEENAITVPHNNFPQDNSCAYSIWNALDNYVPSTWKGLKGVVQDKGPVQVQAKKALKDLEWNFAKKMVSCAAVDFNGLIEEIEKQLAPFLNLRTSVDNQIDMQHMFNMLSLLSGDSFACLQDIASKMGTAALLKIKEIQNNLYQQSASILRLTPDAPRHEVRNTCFSFMKGNAASIKPVTAVEAQPCVIENIERSFIAYFKKEMSQRYSINIEKLLKGESNIYNLQKHLKDTEYENDYEIAIYIVNTLYPAAVALSDDFISDSHAKETECDTIIQAVEVASDADTQDVSYKIVDLIEYCIDKQLAIPNTKGDSSIYDILSKTIQAVYIQHASTTSFQTGMQQKINALTAEQQSAIEKVKQEYQAVLSTDENSETTSILNLKIEHTAHPLQNKIELLQTYCPHNHSHHLSSASNTMFANSACAPSAPPLPEKKCNIK